MKILIVTHYFWPEQFRITDCAVELKKRGHNVVVLAPMPNYPAGVRFPGYGFFRPRRQVYKGIEIVRVPILTRGRKKQGWRLAVSYLSATLFASVIGPLSCRGRCDVIFVYQPSPVTTGIPAIVIKMMKRAPMIFWVQDLWPESLSATGFVRSSLVLAIVERLVRWIYRHCDQILVQSRGFLERVIAQGGNRARIIYFPNWAEDFYKPVALEENAPERGKIPQGFCVMFAGNIGVAQDFPTILAAAEELKECREIQWVILGDGSMREWVAKEIRTRGLEHSVHLIGRYPVEAMPRFFALADVLLVTLKRDPIFALTIPGKVQSYLACGRPIIAALDGEGARVVEEARAGFVAAAEDPHALARCVRNIIALSSAERNVLGRNARAYYETHFDRDRLIEELEQRMEQLSRKRESL